MTPVVEVHSFVSNWAAGNPAGVLLLDRSMDAADMQAIAAEAGFPETAFVRPVDSGDSGFRIRWFSPVCEVELCGHATLAAAFVLLQSKAAAGPEISFHSQTEPLSVTREADGRLALNFPAISLQQLPNIPRDLGEALGCQPVSLHSGPRDWLAVFEDERAVQGLTPDADRIRALATTGLIATAPGSECDYVCRFFAPKLGLLEDPATGSAQCSLAPYWAQRLGKPSLRARQLSARGGEFWCRVEGGRVRIAGYARESHDSSRL